MLAASSPLQHTACEARRTAPSRLSDPAPPGRSGQSGLAGVLRSDPAPEAG